MHHQTARFATHMSADSRFGAPSNWDSSTGERNLKEHAKKPAQTAQMRGYRIFLQQTLKRSVERSAIALAEEDWRLSRWNDWNDGDLNVLYQGRLRSRRSPEITGTIVSTHRNELFDTMSLKIYEITIYVHTETCIAQKGAFATIGSNVYTPPQPVIDAITDHITAFVETMAEATLPEILQFEVVIYSEACLRDRLTGNDVPVGIDRKRYDDILQNGLKLRCHPNYGGEGPWNDWITMIPGEQYSFNESGLSGIPAKLHCLGTYRRIDDDVVHPIAVVHKASTHAFTSVLTEHWLLDYKALPYLGVEGVAPKKYMPVLTVHPTDDIVGRVLAFTEIRNIIDSFAAADFAIARTRCYHKKTRKSYFKSYPETTAFAAIADSDSRPPFEGGYMGSLGVCGMVGVLFVGTRP